MVSFLKVKLYTYIKACNRTVSPLVGVQYLVFQKYRVRFLILFSLIRSKASSRFLFQKKRFIVTHIEM